MEILSTRPPELNPDDVAKSFQMITEYLFKTMESIDFTLAKNRREISETDTSSSGLAEQISGVRGDIVLLSGAVVSLQNRLNTLTEKVNGIRMLPQYVWLRGSAVVAELGGVPDL